MNPIESMERASSQFEAAQTEYRLLKPMPTRSDSARSGSEPRGEEPWDSQIARLFPPRDTPAGDFPSVAGIRLGHFELEERIARGGMGTVFRARDTRLDRVVALKVLSRDQLREQAAIQRFRNEAKAAAKLDHENIARVYFVGEDRGVHFIAFEYVRGTTVREAISLKGRLTPDEAVNYALQAAEALRHTDLAGVVHRDIKPSNLIVTPSGRVKLVDLGLARSLDPANDQDLTVTGTTLGTFDYISPEQARDPRNVDVRSDIYSLGCTMFQMLTGSPPYPDGTTVDKLLQHSTGRPPDPAERNPRISPRLSLVVQRMMAPNPDERYPSPQALIDDLAQIAEGLGLRATAPEGTIWRKPLYRSGSPRWEENRGWIVAFGIIALLAVAGDDVYSWAMAIQRDWQQSRQALTNPAEPPPAHRAEPSRSAIVGASEAPVSREGDTTGSADRGASPPVLRETIAANSIAANGEASQPLPRADAERLEAVAEAAGAAAAAPPTTVAIARDAVPDTIDLSADTPPPPAVPSSTTPSPTAPVVGSISAAATRDQPFVVRSADGSETRYQTLEAACHDARPGSVIDIDHDGLLERAQKPIRIHGKQLTIRPVEGKRPILRFVIGDDPLPQNVVRLIDVRDGSLDLYDLDLHVEVEGDHYADRWVFLSLTRAREIELQRVSLTVANEAARPAVMIERNVPVNEPAPMMPAADTIRETVISLQDCLFRGHATFFSDRTRESATVRLEEVAVAGPEDFLRIEGAEAAEMEGIARAAPVLRFELDHVTAVARTILHISAEENREFPELAVSCRNSVLQAGLDGPAPLLVLEGRQDSEDLLQRVTWSGSWNVLVCDLESACVVRGSLPAVAGDEVRYTLSEFADWQPGWDPSREDWLEESVISLRPSVSTSFVELETSDFALPPPESADEPRNPALGSGNDNTDRGFRTSITKLPSSVSQPG